MLVLPLKIHTRVVTKFKKRAKELFPKELFAYLLGNETIDGLEIIDIWIPEDIEKYAKTDHIMLQDAWAGQVLEYCEDHDVTPLGSLHSHPYSYFELHTRGKRVENPDHSTSEADADCGLTSRVHGICRILQSKTGRLTATIKFWGPELPVREEYVKNN